MVFPANTKIIGHFLNEQLTKTLPRLYETNYDDLWGLNPQQNFHRAVGDLPLGLDFLDAYFKSDAGQMAALYDGNGDDIPTVELAIGKKTVPCAMFVQGANWNVLQLEKMRTAQASNSAMPTLNIVTAKQDIAADYFNRREHYTALYGYPKVGIRGVLDQIGISVSDVAFRPYVKAGGAYTLTTDELYENMTDLIYAFIARARLSNPGQVQMMIAPKLGRRLVEIYKTSNGQTVGGMTVKQMLQSEELGLGVSSIQVRNELAGDELSKHIWNESATGYYPASQDRIVFKATTYNPERHFYARRPFQPFQRSTLEWEVIMIGSTSGVLNFEDEKMMYFDYSNATT